MVIYKNVIVARIVSPKVSKAGARVFAKGGYVPRRTLRLLRSDSYHFIPKNEFLEATRIEI